MTIRPIVDHSRRARRALGVRRGGPLAASVAVLLGAFTPGTSVAAGPFLPSSELGVAAGVSLGVMRAASAADGTAFVTWPSKGPQAHAMVAVHSPGGVWSVQDLGRVYTDPNGSSSDAIPVQAASDGSAVVLVNNPVTNVLEAVDRLPGGAFAARHVLSFSGSSVRHPALAFSPNGTAVAAWLQEGGGSYTAYARVREAGGWDRPAKALNWPAALKPANVSESTYEVGMSAAVNDAGRAAVGFSLFDGTAQRALVAVRSSGADFGVATGLDASASPSDAAHVAVTAEGAVAAQYNLGSGTPSGQHTFVRFAPPGSATFGAPEAANPAGTATFFGQSASIAAGPGEMFQIATASSASGGTPGSVALTTARPLGAIWRVLPAAALASAGTNNARPRIAVGASGDRLLVWEDYSTKALMAVASPRGSAVWGPPHTTSTGTPDPQSQAAIAVDEQGNAVVAFTTLSTQPSVSFRARVAGFDAAPPSLSAVLISPSVSASFPAAFSAVASDVWSTPRVSWSFGDGGTADGASVSHVFGTPNASSATVTATDDVGHSTSQSGPVTVVLGDRDRDGVLSDRDCDDANAGVRPGSRDVPGNGVDENCDGADANWATLATTVRLDWVRTRRGLRVASLGVRGVRQGDTIVVRCRGGGCKRASYRLVLSRAPKHAAASLNAATRGATLRAGTALTVEVDRQDYSTRVTTWTVRSGKGPKQSVRCRIPGAKTTQVCA